MRVCRISKTFETDVFVGKNGIRFDRKFRTFSYEHFFKKWPTSFLGFLVFHNGINQPIPKRDCSEKRNKLVVVVDIVGGPSPISNAEARRRCIIPKKAYVLTFQMGSVRDSRRRKVI